jgi:hypothetical protein
MDKPIPEAVDVEAILARHLPSKYWDRAKAAFAALTAAQQQGQAVAWRLWRTNAVTGEWMPCTREWNDGAPEPGIAESLNNRVSQHRVEVAYAAPPPSVPVGVDGPLSVFSAGEWRYSETGQTFSAKDLDEAAFVVYRDHLAQQPAAVECPHRTRCDCLAACKYGYAGDGATQHQEPKS